MVINRGELIRENHDEMARCKAANLVTLIPDCPPPYARYDVAENYAGDATNSSRLNGFYRSIFRSTSKDFTLLKPRKRFHEHRSPHDYALAIPTAEVRTPVTNAIGGRMANRRRCTYFVGGVVAILVCAFLTIEMFPYPLRASCTVQWGFDEPCTFVMQRLRCQILKWTSCSDCGYRGNRCLYSIGNSIIYKKGYHHFWPKVHGNGDIGRYGFPQNGGTSGHLICEDFVHLHSLTVLKNGENNTIRATHLSPNLQLLDDIKIVFEGTRSNSCVATGKSMSRAWFVMFDYGTNYCNLRNLVNGAGLDVDRGFMEFTNNAVCTQLNTALCA